MANISQTISGITYKTPFVVAASPLTDNADLVKQAEECGAGAASIKLTMYKQPMKGIRQMYVEKGQVIFNPSDKRNDMDQGLDLMRRCKEATSDIKLWANIAGSGGDLETWNELALEMQKAGADAIELNFICPNMNLAAVSLGQDVAAPKTGALIGKDPEMIEAVIGSVKKAVSIPVWAKLTHEVSDYLSIVKAVVRGNADGVVINGTPFIAPPIDIRRGGRTKMATYRERCSFGGSGGPVNRRISYRLIGTAALDSDIPIAGGGGLDTYEHCIEAIMFGASLVTMCYKLTVDGFSVMKDFAGKISGFMDEYGYEDIPGMKGAALKYICTTPELDNDYSYAVVDKDKCVGCGACEKIGSCYAIRIAGAKAVVAEDLCQGCGICKTLCPRGAIGFESRGL